MTDRELILHSLETACQRFVEQRQNCRPFDEYVDWIEQAVKDYRAAAAAPQPPTLGVSVSDGLGVEDKFG